MLKNACLFNCFHLSTPLRKNLSVLSLVGIFGKLLSELNSFNNIGLDFMFVLWGLVYKMTRPGGPLCLRLLFFVKIGTFGLDLLKLGITWIGLVWLGSMRKNDRFRYNGSQFHGLGTRECANLSYVTRLIVNDSLLKSYFMNWRLRNESLFTEQLFLQALKSSEKKRILVEPYIYLSWKYFYLL